MELLSSSIIGKEFVNYRKNTMTVDRQQFSNKVRYEGLGNIPIVIDSVDKELSEALGHYSYRNQSKFGREVVKHMDEPLSSVMRDVKIILIQRDKENLIPNLVLGLENGTIPDQESELGKLYKAHRNTDDKILYLMLTKEQGVYGYVMSIIRYLGESIWKVVGRSQV